MSDIYQDIKLNLAHGAASLGIQINPEDITLEHPANPEFGDVSTNIALAHWKTAKKADCSAFSNPREFATQLHNFLQGTNSPSDNVAGPGFLNFKYPDQNLLEHINAINANQNVLSQLLSEKRITIEFTDPNPFKEFHIGHLYSNTVGESICRLLEAVGANVRRVCYQGDVGMHVAKAVWGMLKQTSQDTGEALRQLEAMQSQTIHQRVKFMGHSYAIGAAAYEDETQAQTEMKVLNKHIFEKNKTIDPIYQLGRKWSLEYFETVYKRLGTKFEGYYFESEVGPKGTVIVREFLSKGVFEESKGAIIFPGSKYGLHDRVFINSLGLPTYEAKELGLAPTKEQDWPSDQSIIITANEIDEYFKVLLKALSLTSPDLAAKTNHLSHGVVRLPEGKMSSRKGNILTGEWLLDEVKSKVAKVLENNRSDMSTQEKEHVAEIVAVAAVKYALLKNSIGGNISFSIDESVNFEGNSGPYIQYTFARCKSVMQKAGRLQAISYPPSHMTLQLDHRSGIHSSSFGGQSKLQAVNLESDERAVLTKLYQFSEAVERAVNEYAPHYVATYLFELASAFNHFYNTLQILKAEDSVKDFRLSLTQATSIILQQGLHILGIQTVEQM